MTSCVSTSCPKLVSCDDGWPKTEPIFSHQIDDTDVLFVGIFPVNIEKVQVFWGGRDTTTYFKPFPVVITHRLITTITGYKIRVLTTDTEGAEKPYTYEFEVN